MDVSALDVTEAPPRLRDRGSSMMSPSAAITDSSKKSEYSSLSSLSSVSSASRMLEGRPLPGSSTAADSDATGEEAESGEVEMRSKTAASLLTEGPAVN